METINVDTPAKEGVAIPAGKHACIATNLYIISLIYFVTTSEIGLPRKPKGGKTDFIDGSCSEDEAQDRANTANKRKTEKPKPVRRSAQEIANSLKGAKDITATSIKLKRVRRSPVADKIEKVQQPPWLKASLNAPDENDDEDNDELPDIRALVDNARRKSQKRARETSNHEEENSPVPPTKIIKVEQTEPASSFERSPTVGRPMLPRCRSQTLMPEMPRRPLSPARFSSRIMASPPLSPIKEASSTVSVPTKVSKQPLFRPPSASERKQKENVKHKLERLESEIDELESSSA